MNLGETKKPIVWHIVAWWPTIDKPGNGLFIRAHIESIGDFAHHYIVYLKASKKPWTLPSIKIEHKSSGIEEFLVDVSLPIRRFGLHEMFTKKGYEKAFVQMEKTAGKPDLIHLHVRSHLTKHAIPALLRQNAPIVFTEHFSFYHRGIKSLSTKDQEAETQDIKTFLQRPNLKQTMPVSEELKGILIESFGAEEKKVTVIPNIADACFDFKPFQKGNQIRISLVAGWHFPKNPILFFQAIERLPQEIKNRLHIDFIGHGSQLELVKRHIQAHINDLDIVVHGYLNKPSIAQYLQQSDFFVHPTDQENLPTVIAEALCCGTPVLSMNVNGIPEMVDTKNGILVEPKNLEAMAIGLHEMIERSDSFYREAISVEARKRYGKSEIGTQILNVYKSALR
jgi:glycosyltransferase involved in cell wall biosynthesis